MHLKMYVCQPKYQRKDPTGLSSGIGGVAVSDWMAINGNDADRLCQMADDIAYVRQQEPDVQYTQAPPEEGNGQPSDPSRWRRTHEGLALETLTRLNGNYRWIHDLSPDLRGDAGWAHWEGERWIFGPPRLSLPSLILCAP